MMIQGKEIGGLGLRIYLRNPLRIYFYILGPVKRELKMMVIGTFAHFQLILIGSVFFFPVVFLCL